MLALSGILFACLMGAMSPGPSFLLVARSSIAESRQNGMAGALGMGVGATTLAILALLGLKALFAGLPLLYSALKVVGGLYLVYIAIQIWRGASVPITMQTDDVQGQSTLWHSFTTALFTQLSNPKAVVFYGSIFAALLPQTVSPLMTVLLPIFVLLIETAWYCIVALVLSATGPRNIYLRSKLWIDRTTGGVLGFLGVKLIISPDSIG